MNSLRVMDIDKVNQHDRNMIENGIKQAMEGLERNGQVTILTLQSVTALMSGHARWRELKEQGQLTRMFRSITGKNRSIREAMERDLFHFHFIAQQTLQELVDRQCFTLDMIAAVHCKFNQLFDESDRNFEQVYKHLHAFFDITEEKLRGMNNRLTEAEKNIDLLNWHATLTIRRNYSGVKYAELKDIEKVVYLTRDFFEVTKGNWSDQNFLLLESAIEHLQLSGSMNLLQFFSGFDRHLVEELLKPVGIGNIDEIGFDSLFMLKVLLQKYDLAGASLDQAPFTYQEAFFKNHFSIRDLIFDLLSELSVLQELTRPVEEEKVVYEVVLHQFSDADLRIDIVREIKYHTGLSLETCRSMVKNVPTSVIRYDSYEEAQQLKSKLEQHQCVIEIV